MPPFPKSGNRNLSGPDYPDQIQGGLSPPILCQLSWRTPVWVKLRRTQHEHMFSALHLELGHCSTQSACLKRPSRPGEFHPEPLTDPDLTLSRHPARATARRLPPSVENGAPPVASWLTPNVGDLPPSLHGHYTRFLATTKQSAPGRRI